VSKYSEFLGPKHKVFWQNKKYFGKTFSVLSKHFLFCQNTFCVYLLGLFIRFGEKLFQDYIQHTEKREMLMPMVVFKGARHGRIAARNICNQTQGMVYSMPMQLKPQQNIFWFPMTAQRSTLAIKY